MVLGGFGFAAVVVFVVVVVVVVVSVRRLSSRVRRGNGCRGKESARRCSLPGQGGKGGGVPARVAELSLTSGCRFPQTLSRCMTGA